MDKMEKRNQIIKDCKDYTIFTWVAQDSYNPPIAIERADGIYVYDYDGKRYYDMNSQLTNVSHGHNNQAMIKAIQDQAAELAYCGPRYACEMRAKLGKLIIEEVAPKYMKKVLFTCGGADANEYAIRMVRQVTGRNKIFSKYESYHGSSYGAGMLTGEAERSCPFPTIAGFLRFAPPNMTHYNAKDKFKTEEEWTEHFLANLDYMFQMEGAHDIAAVWIESVTGSNGVYKYPKGYLKGIREICTKYGALMVCDEVMDGFYRCGPEVFACMLEGVEPDVITFAKGVNSGYAPLGGVLVNQKICDFYKDHALPCGLTYNSHPLGMAAAYAGIKEYQRMNMKEHMAEISPIYTEKMQWLQNRHDCILECRNVGLLGCIEYNTENQAFMSEKVFPTLFANGFCTLGHHRNSMCSLPLIVTKEQLDEFFSDLDKVMDILDEEIKKYN